MLLFIFIVVYVCLLVLALVRLPFWSKNDFAKIAKAYSSVPEKIALNAALLIEPIMKIEAG